jgi:hypothetical protein
LRTPREVARMRGKQVEEIRGRSILDELEA